VLAFPEKEAEIAEEMKDAPPVARIVLCRMMAAAAGYDFGHDLQLEGGALIGPDHVATPNPGGL
jgi:hypothetical protein